MKIIKIDEKEDMNKYNLFIHRRLTVICAIWITCIFCGCQQSEIQPQKDEVNVEPVFFPPMPDKPRLQFLKSFSSPEELFSDETKSSNTSKVGWFEELIVGEEEETPQTEVKIIRPYGTAINNGKLYVCDTARGVLVLDLVNHTDNYLTQDPRLINPVEIWIDGGNKYVTDPKASAIFVFDKDNKLTSIFGRDSEIVPLSVVVRGQKCYVTDQTSKQVIVFDKIIGNEIERIGKRIPDGGDFLGNEKAQFRLIGDIALDQDGNSYISDRVTAQITKFDSEGRFVRTYGKSGDAIADFVRPKGIAVDRENRIWIVDAATQVCKIYNQEGLLLLYFGMAGNTPGMMNMPGTVTIDYDNVKFFEKYAAEGAQLEFLVIITNQYGPHKVSIYGFGSFPLQEKMIEEAKKQDLQSEPEAETKEKSTVESQKEEQ